MSTEEKPIPTVKDGLTSPIKESDAKILQATQAGKHPSLAVKEAGLKMAGPAAKTYVEHIKRKYMDSQGGLLVALENVGVNLETVAGKIKDGLEATRTTKSGQSVIHVPDHSTRHKYLETTLDVMGARAPKEHVVSTHSTHEHHVNVVDALRSNPDALLKLRERLQQRNAADAIEINPEQPGNE
jgi:hypothetical protein